MGCDGGTIPRRDELVRVKKKPEKVDKDAANAAKWKHCAISQQPLVPPIVSCELGKLYNKVVVIEHLLAKDASNEVAKHIRNLSDVKELKLTVNNGYDKEHADKSDRYVDVHASRFICPVSRMEMNGKQKFCYSWKCGCVLSEKAIKEVKSETCHKCGAPTRDADLIVLNGTEAEVTILKEKMEERRQKAKIEKKRKKASQSVTCEGKKVKVEDEEKPSTSKVNEPTSNGSKLEKPSTSKVKEEATSSGSKLEKPTVKNGVKNGLGNGDISARKSLLPEKARSSYSIAKDPNVSAAFKSLFTSHDKAKNQTKAHWVTHNPQYF